MPLTDSRTPPATATTPDPTAAGWVVCAWCRRPLGRNALLRGLISHSICRPCFDDLLHPADHDWPRGQ